MGERQSGICRFIVNVLKQGDRVSVRDLSRGLIVDSGNDACVALADYIAGGQPQFVAMMNSYVQKLKLQDTHFETVHGLDARASTVRLTIWLCYRGLSFTASLISIICTARRASPNGITQQNRNGLLWDKTLNVDGLKTGHTSGAGFNLIASAVDGQRRLIAVVMGPRVRKGVKIRRVSCCNGDSKTLTQCRFCVVVSRSALSGSGMAIKKNQSRYRAGFLDGAA